MPNRSIVPLIPREINAHVLLKFCASPGVMKGYEAICAHAQLAALDDSSMCYESKGDHLIFYHSFAESGVRCEEAERMSVREIWVVTRPLKEIDPNVTQSHEVEK